MAQEENYPAHPDSLVKPGVPQGKLEGPFVWKSEIYPGTERNYQLYIPAQYDASKPACVFVVQDGIGRAKEWKLPTVMDNLIATGEMPVTIGIFIEPGVVPAPNENAQPRFNRSFEYDGLGDRYARFLEQEILPEVAKTYNLSSNPNDRAIGGASSGAICAFNAAWERPDLFRRVMSTIGTYVGLRGADELSTLVRKTEPKPLRVFLQDGDHDLNIYAGDWFVANLQLLSALEYSGYEVEHVWGKGGHNGKQGAAIMPDAMRWLWKDHPKPIAANFPKQARVNVLIPDQNWELVSQGHTFADGPAVGPSGEVYFVDVSTSTIFVSKEIEGKIVVEVFAKDSGNASGLMFGPDNKLYACQYNGKKIVRYSLDGKMEVIAENCPCNDLVVYQHGIYYTDPSNKKIFHLSFDGKKQEVDSGIALGNGLIVSPDQTLLHVADTDGRFTYSFQIQNDGTLKYKQEYGYLHTPDATSRSAADGMTMDNNGYLYVATALGIQVIDQPGRVNQIISKPQRAFLSNVAFGGPNRDYLYATCGDKVFRRKTNAKGNVSWEAPIKPPKPGL
jgi:sugar lactone lactonase YvrE/enterochelin esterase-like enzyme